MKIEIIKDTIYRGQKVKKGTELEVSGSDGKLLVSLNKAKSLEAEVTLELKIADSEVIEKMIKDFQGEIAELKAQSKKDEETIGNQDIYIQSLEGQIENLKEIEESYKNILTDLYVATKIADFKAIAKKYLEE